MSQQSKFAKLLVRLYGSRRVGMLQNGINWHGSYQQGDSKLHVMLVEVTHPTWTHAYFALTNRVVHHWRILETRREKGNTISLMARTDRYPRGEFSVVSGGGGGGGYVHWKTG